MVFFQFFLLAGYIAAYSILKVHSGTTQILMYAVLLTLALAFLPFDMKAPSGVDPALHPFAWVLMSFTLSLGAPILVLAMTNTLVQGWITQSRIQLGFEPYVLYAASNAGSLLALLVFFLLEYLYPLPQIRSLWTHGFFILAILMMGSAVYLRALNPAPVTESDAATKDTGPTGTDRLFWVALAFIPSGLFLAITTYITTNVSSIPLLWVVPLALYLVTFILAFSSWARLADVALKLQVPIIVLTAFLLTIRLDALQLLPVHLLCLFLVALNCHTLLARSKPHPYYLGEFYLYLALGGVLGGLFCSLLAPMLFNGPWEYPLLLIGACFARPRLTNTERAKASTSMNALAAVAVIVIMGAVFYFIQPVATSDFTKQILARPVFLTALIGAAWLCEFLSQGKVTFALVVAALFLSSGLDADPFVTGSLYVHRNCFGVDYVYHVSDPKLGVDANVFRHGTILHSIQSHKESLRLKPAAYYWPLKPVYGLLDEDARHKPVALLGLAAGTLLCINRQAHVDTFEINPDALKIAENPKLFTYMRDCTPSVTNYLGDGRINLQRMDNSRYGFIILDAFSSDAIPTHLLTREAVSMYKAKLAPGGMIAFNVTNQFFRLVPLFATLVKDLSLEGYFIENVKPTEPYGFTASWVVLSPSFTEEQRQQLTKLHWNELQDTGGTVWTDQYSNVLPYLRVFSKE
jgi:hypothetical protein